MLTVTCLRKLGLDPVKTDDVSVVLIYDSFDNPIAVVMEIQNNVTTVVTAAEDSFEKTLEGLGIDKIVKVKNIPVSSTQRLTHGS